MGRTAFALVLVLGGSAVVACSFRGLDSYDRGGDDAVGGTAGAGAGAGAAGGGGGAATTPDAGAGGSVGILPDGALCASGAVCASGHCVAGVCCDAACDGACMACTAAAKESGELDGACGPAKAGTDPAGDCDEGVDACASDGKCDGRGSCSFPAAGTVCAPPMCAGGMKSLSRVCDGGGTCIDTGVIACAMGCDGPVCVGDCLSNDDCTSDEFCDPISNQCEEKFDNGATCQTPEACQSGFCVDGVCCDSACTGPCRSCRGSLTPAIEGTCSPVLEGTDPDDDCADLGAASCGQDGLCAADGSCRLYGAAAECEAVSCTGETQTNAKTCDGAGNCESNGTLDCSPFLCNGFVCGSSCASAGDCIDGASCEMGACQGQRSDGAACVSAIECLSGFCVDGVCCNSACTGSCRACSSLLKGAGADGVCDHVVAGQDPDDDCPQDVAATCDRDGTCDGSGGCRDWPAGTVCAPRQCLPVMQGLAFSEQHHADTCNGNGTCVDGGKSHCQLYTCNGDVCRTSCSAPAHCALGNCIGSVCVFNPPF